MCNIIQFPTSRIQNTNGYNNLVALFKICDSVESCNFYLETTEQLYKKDSITEYELLTLRRIGRQKRIELATPKQEVIKAIEPGEYIYTSEMGQQKPEGCQMEAGRSYYGRHYWVKTSLELKGRGITKNEPSRDGKQNYTVTEKAFEKLKAQYSIAMECYLD